MALALTVWATTHSTRVAHRLAVRNAAHTLQIIIDLLGNIRAALIVAKDDETLRAPTLIALIRPDSEVLDLMLQEGLHAWPDAVAFWEVMKVKQALDMFAVSPSTNSAQRTGPPTLGPVTEIQDRLIWNVNIDRAVERAASAEVRCRHLAANLATPGALGKVPESLMDR